MNQFPLNVPVGMLTTCHPDFDQKLICEIGDFAEGGKRMDARKLLYLKPRGADSNPQYAKSRFLSTIYTNYFGQQLDAIAAEIVEGEPEFETSDANDYRSEFWMDLSDDCDGKGNDATLVAQNAVLDILKFRRAFLVVEMPDVAGFPGETLASAKERGRLDGRFVNVPAESVDDWQETNGRLDWIRVHTVEQFKPNPVVNVRMERHAWTYYTADAIYTYTASRQLPSSSLLSAQWDEKATAGLTVKPNIFGVCPVVAMTANFSLGDRLLPTARALFNGESARSFLIEASALALPILITDKPADQIPMNELAVLNPGIGGSFSFASPPASVFEALKIYCDDLKANFDRIISNLAEHGAALIQNPRQSAQAKQLDRAPKEILLSLFSMPVADGFRRAIKMLAGARGDEAIEPSLCGLDDEMGADVTKALTDCTTFLALPVPPVARAAALLQLCNTYLPGMTETERKLLGIQLSATNQPAITATATTGASNVQNSGGTGVTTTADSGSGNAGGASD